MLMGEREFVKWIGYWMIVIFWGWKRLWVFEVRMRKILIWIEFNEG